MKKFLLIFYSITLLGCEKQNLSSQSKIISEKNFNCSGSYLNKQFSNDSKSNKKPYEASGRIEYPMVIRKLDKPIDSSTYGKFYGDILLGSNKSFPICYEDKFEIVFFPTCNVSSPQENLPNSNHRGVINKFDGEFIYRVKYDLDNSTYIENLYLECKPI